MSHEQILSTMGTYHYQAIHYSGSCEFVGPGMFGRAVPSLCFGGSRDSIHGEVEERHQILEDIFGNTGACSSSTLRHVVVGTRLARVLAFSWALRSAPEPTDMRGSPTVHGWSDHPNFRVQVGKSFREMWCPIVRDPLITGDLFTLGGVVNVHGTQFCAGVMEPLALFRLFGKR